MTAYRRELLRAQQAKSAAPAPTAPTPAPSEYQRGYMHGFLARCNSAFIIGAYLGVLACWLVISSGVLTP